MRSSLLILALLATGCSDPEVVDATTTATGDTDIVVTTDDGTDVVAAADVVIDEADSVEATDGVPATPAASSGTASAKTGDEDDGPSARAGQGRAATKTVTLSAEGEDYTQAVKLAAFPDFPVPFSTYIHDDMTVEQPGSGEAVSLEWGAGSVLVNWRRGDTVEAAVARVRANVPNAEAFPVHWAQAAFLFESGDAVGTVFVVVRDGGTVLTIESSSSTEGAEGKVNVEDVVLGEWRWADGSPLRG